MSRLDERVQIPKSPIIQQPIRIKTTNGNECSLVGVNLADNSFIYYCKEEDTYYRPTLVPIDTPERLSPIKTDDDYDDKGLGITEVVYRPSPYDFQDEF